MNLFVRNLPYSMNEEEIKNLFSEIGQVVRVHLVKDKQTDQSRGFSFVEMSDEDGNRAILELNKTKVQGRTIYLSESDKDRRK